MPYTGLFPRYSHQTAMSSHTMLTCLPCVTAGVASSLHCVLELDNSRLVTQSVTRSSNPVWNKQFVLMVRDMTSCLAISVLDRERNMKAKKGFRSSRRTTRMWAELLATTRWPT